MWIAVLTLMVLACNGETECESGADCATTSTTSGGGGAGGEPEESLAEAYCNCMLTSCHDAYHDAYGPDTDEVAARANCLETAEMWPEAGMNVMQGDFVECRIHFCVEGRTDPDVCPQAVGPGACEP